MQNKPLIDKGEGTNNEINDTCDSHKSLLGKDEEKKLTTKDFLFLTLALAGVQFTWSVELAYGTPYLLSLGLPKSLTVLVWLAGPLSGLIIQPLIGFYSDRCTSKYGRRRPYILFGTLLVVTSILCISYSKEIGHFIATGNNEKLVTIWIAVIAFYGLDFAINIVQACCRALSIDVSPGNQQNQASIWSSRMIGIGNILGYFMGFINLELYFPFLGSTQLKILCVIANITLITCVLLTCLKTHEQIYCNNNNDTIKWYTPLLNIIHSMSNLPSPIQNICNVQFWSWIGWFPFLFFTTAWINFIYYKDHTEMAKNEVNDNNATRIGSLALLIYSIVSLLASFILPLLKSKQDSRNNIDPQAFYKKVWIFSELFLASTFIMTIFVNKIWHAIVIISLCGFSWAVSMWIPFALIGEFLEGYSKVNENSVRTVVNENEEEEEEQNSSGIILGIHNMYVVLPQFVVTFLSSAFFAFIKFLQIQEENFDGFGWILRFGGIGAIISTLLIPRINFKVKRM